MKHSKKQEKMEQLFELLSKLVDEKQDDTKADEEVSDSPLDGPNERKYTKDEIVKIFLSNKDWLKEEIVMIAANIISEEVDFEERIDCDSAQYGIDGDRVYLEDISFDEFRLQEEIEEALRKRIDALSLVDSVMQALGEDGDEMY